MQQLKFDDRVQLFCSFLAIVLAVIALILNYINEIDIAELH